ncbi:MAG: HXXEE domain-containing protein [candidate division Zixibacteria bacterium]|nr:HXXEE domain-containing protein [candidate division Zixibacteria bacterium]
MRRLYLALVCTQAMHSAEEIAFGFNHRTPELGAWFKTIVPGFPIVSFSTTVFVLLNIAIVAIFAASVLLVYRGTKWAEAIMTIVAIGEFFNGAAHFTMAVIAGGYFPGIVSGVALLILSILVLRSTLRPDMLTVKT